MYCFVMQHKVYFLEIVMWMKSMGMLIYVQQGEINVQFLLLQTALHVSGDNFTHH
jgi:hypothetical protein